MNNKELKKAVNDITAELREKLDYMEKDRLNKEHQENATRDTKKVRDIYQHIKSLLAK